MMRGFGPYGYGHMAGGGLFGGIFMLFFGLLILAGIVLLIVWAIRALSGGHQPSAQHQQAAMQQPLMEPPAAPVRADGHDEAVAIAKRRLAGGEITPEQYAEIMRTLGG